MKISEINTMVGSIGLSFDYYQFPDGTDQAPPYVLWFLSRDNDMMADDENYCDIEQLNIELYTSFKDFEKEAQVESALKANNFTYHKESVFIDSEKLYQTSYEMEVLIHEEE